MAKWIVGNGLNSYIEYLQKINAVTDEVIGEAVYEMAKVVADSVRASIQALPTVSNEANIATYKKGYSRLSDKEKQGLLDGFGISPLQEDSGFVNVKLGFDGYNSVKTKKYPQGQPNALIARVTESGSSYREKTPFMRPAVNASKKPAEAAGRAKFDERIAAIPQK
jgi:hypothetical protein